ncbi:15717_t:CDS:1, partial [Funneliformis mosseae]
SIYKNILVYLFLYKFNNHVSETLTTASETQTDTTESNSKHLHFTIFSDKMFLNLIHVTFTIDSGIQQIKRAGTKYS